MKLGRYYATHGIEKFTPKHLFLLLITSLEILEGMFDIISTGSAPLLKNIQGQIKNKAWSWIK